jgi:hypothetical protein
MTMTLDALALDLNALLELANRHPAEWRKLRQSLVDGSPAAESNGDPPWIPTDRHDKVLSLRAMVVTADGEVGRIVRFDRNSSRALVELDTGGTRMLSLKRLELKRGRPRKDSFAVVTPIVAAG